MSALRFPGSAFPADHNTLHRREIERITKRPGYNVITQAAPHLVGVVRHHGLVGDIGHGEDVWWVCRTLSADVQLGVLGNTPGKEV